MAAERYDGVAIALHWTTVALVAVLLASGLTIGSGYEGPLKNALFAIHKATGLLTFAVVAFRLTRRLLRGTPALPPSVPPTVGRVAGVWHRLLYVALIVMPITGYVHTVTGGYPVEVLNALGVPPLFAKNKPVSDAFLMVHMTLAWIFIALIAGHAAAVAWHDLARHDGIMRRMLPGRARPTGG